MVLQLAAMVMGGTASIAGSVLGGFLIVAIQEVVREFRFSIEIAFGGLLAFFVLVRPTGLIDIVRSRYPAWRERLEGYGDYKPVEDERATAK